MKRLLNEDTTRKFMKLAKLEPLTNSFLEKVEEGTGKAGNTARTDIANKATGRWLKEEEEVSEDAELTEENEVTEEDVTEEGMGPAYGRDDEEEAELGDEPVDAPVDDLPPLDDEPVDDLGAEPAGGGGDLDVTAIVQAVTDALAQELDSQGHPVDIDVEGGEGLEGEEAPIEEPLGDDGAEEFPPEEAAPEEDPVLEDFDSAGITVEEELDEEYLNEITRRVAQRLLEKTKNNQ